MLSDYTALGVPMNVSSSSMGSRRPGGGGYSGSQYDVWSYQVSCDWWRAVT